MNGGELEVRGIGVSFGGLQAVADLSFKVRPGSIKAVIGPNGAGKSTLFNVISGIQPPTTGEVLLDGRSLSGLPPHRRAERGIARTFQNLQIFGGMSVVENVMVGRHCRMHAGLASALFRLPSGRHEEAQACRHCLELLDAVGLAHKADAATTSLSFGDLKIVEIARALAGEPRVLLLDEPTAGLPGPEAQRMAGVIQDISQRGVTVLLVEHNMRVVMSISDDILVLNFGRQIADGEPAEVRRHPDVIAAYLGEDVRAGA
ncbi:MAG: ABC transporter ATP-binding protein [Pseudomonadota bacterium]|nr:ABC transporter ATP-binding protein [Pseudomonadota bacterium]